MLFKNLFRNFSRSSRRRRGAIVTSAAQLLEPRALPAGTVTAQLVGTTLFLTGDRFDNQVTITVSETGIELVGNDTAVRFQGHTHAAEAPVHLTDEVNGMGGLVANMQSGNDALNVNVLTSATLNGSVFAYLGGLRGSDSDLFRVDVAAGVNFEVTGSVIANLGQGNDFFRFENFGTTVIGGNLMIDAGTGSDSVIVSDLLPTSLEIQGATTITTGSGVDLIDIVGGEIALNGPVTINTGADADVVNIFANVGGHASLGSTLSVATGGGNDVVTVQGTIDIDGATTINLGEGHNCLAMLGDPTAVTNATFGPTAVGDQNLVIDSNVTIYGFGGDDTIALAGVAIAESLFVYAGNGKDCLGAFNVSVEGSAWIYGEAGNDSIIADVVKVAGWTIVDAGSGNDSVMVDEVTFGSLVWVLLGLGNDNLIAGTVVAEEPSLVLLDGNLGTDKIIAPPDLEDLIDAGALVLFFDDSLSEGSALEIAAAAVTKIQTKFGLEPEDD